MLCGFLFCEFRETRAVFLSASWIVYRNIGANFSLNDLEGGDFRFNKERSTKEYNIAANFFTKRALNTEAIV